MVSIPKLIVVLSCGFLLCLGPSIAARADETDREGGQAGFKNYDDKFIGGPISQPGRIGGQAGLKSDEDKLKGSHITMPGREGGQAGLRGDDDKLRALMSSRTIKGEVLSVKGNTYYLHRQDGKTVRVYTDQATKKIGDIHKGTSIEAEVNDQGHVLSIHSAEPSDRQNEADRKG